MKALTKLELDRLLDNVTSVRLRAMIHFGFRHAARASEIVGLRRADLDLENKTVTVRRLKNSLTTTQPLGEDEYLALSAWLKIAPESSFVFPGRNGKHLNRSILNREFKVVCQYAKIPKDKQHPHAIKHAACMHLIRNGMGLVHLQTYVGHAAIQSTMQYLKLTQDESCEEAKKAFGG